MYSKAFYDSACGGTKEAKAQAISWRDEQLKTVEALTLLDLHTQKRSNNVSGVPGVHFHKTGRQPLGFWQAKIRFHDGITMAKSFSVRLHGNQEAFDMAVAARADLLSLVENKAFLHHAVAKRIAKQD